MVEFSTIGWGFLALAILSVAALVAILLRLARTPPVPAAAAVEAPAPDVAPMPDDEPAPAVAPETVATTDEVRKEE